MIIVRFLQAIVWSRPGVIPVVSARISGDTFVKNMFSLLQKHKIKIILF